MTEQGRYIRYAAPAPVEQEDRVELQETNEDTRLHHLCEDWACWLQSRKFYGAPKSLSVNSIARWAAPMRATASVGKDAACSAELQRFNSAVGMVLDGYRDVKPGSKAPLAFTMFYVERVRPVKTIAGRLGVGRQQAYTLIREFRRAVARNMAKSQEAATRSDALSEVD